MMELWIDERYVKKVADYNRILKLPRPRKKVDVQYINCRSDYVKFIRGVL